MLSPLLSGVQEKGHHYGLAETAYTAGKFQEALDYYQSAHSDNIPADVHFNIGNCYYRLDQPGRAALHYHRALYKNPNPLSFVISDCLAFGSFRSVSST